MADDKKLYNSTFWLSKEDDLLYAEYTNAECSSVNDNDEYSNCVEELTSAYPYYELVAIECDNYRSDADFFDDFQYPSASASYATTNEFDQNYVNLLDTDQQFLDIYDSLAKEDGSFELGPSPVAMPIVYAVPEEYVNPSIVEIPNSKIQHAKVVDAVVEPTINKPKIIFRLKVDNETIKKRHLNRRKAIFRWKQKKYCSDFNKKVQLNSKSARSEAACRRSRDTEKGHYKRCNAKWVSAADCFKTPSSNSYLSSNNILKDDGEFMMKSSEVLKDEYPTKYPEPSKYSTNLLDATCTRMNANGNGLNYYNEFKNFT